MKDTKKTPVKMATCYGRGPYAVIEEVPAPHVVRFLEETSKKAVKTV